MTWLPRSGAALTFILVLVCARPSAAQDVTLSWDPSPSPSVTGYIVTYGTAPGVRPYMVDAGAHTTLTLSSLQSGVRYYFAVRAYDRYGLYSPPSPEVSGVPVAGSLVDVDLDGLDDRWEAKYLVSDPAADDDHDGLDNLTEFLRGTHPRLPNTVYLTEGATGGFIERIALVNPDDVPADVVLRFLVQNGAPVTWSVYVPALARTTVDVNGIPGLASAAVTTVVEATRGGIVAERTMFWRDANGALGGGHTGRAVAALSKNWFLAEGDAGFFDTWILVANPNPTGVPATIDFLLDTGSVVTRNYVLKASSRFSVWANLVPGLAGHAFSTRITTTSPVAAERAMYFKPNGTNWSGGHAGPGVTAPSTTWYVAEGKTGPVFDTWLLLANPNPVAAKATISYLTPRGLAYTESVGIAANSRKTVHVDDRAPVADTDVSAVIASTQPIVVERSMYWPGTPATWLDAHNTVGASAFGTEWVLAEGETGGAQNFQSYILLANPTAQGADVTLTVLRENQPAFSYSKYVAASSRVTIASFLLGLQNGERFGVRVQASSPIVVERSMYWDGPGQPFRGGTNELGILVR